MRDKAHTTETPTHPRYPRYPRNPDNNTDIVPFPYRPLEPLQTNPGVGRLTENYRSDFTPIALAWTFRNSSSKKMATRSKKKMCYLSGLVMATGSS